MVPYYKIAAMKNITGQNIKAIRRQKQLTQHDLAARLQIRGYTFTRTIIAKIENGYRQVLDIEVKAIADALEVPISRLFEDRNANS